MTNLTLLLCCSSLTLALGAQSPAPAPSPQPAPQRLSGVWVLNKDISSKPPAPPATSDRGGDPAGDPGGDRGGGGGRRGGFGGGPPPGGRGPSGDEDSAKARTLTQEIGQSPDRLTLVLSDAMLSITDSDGVSRRFLVNGKTEKVAIAGYSVEVKSRWKDESLEQEFKTGTGTIVRTFETTTNGNLLLVTANLKGQDRVNRFVFVYDRMDVRW